MGQTVNVDSESVESLSSMLWHPSAPCTRTAPFLRSYNPECILQWLLVIRQADYHPHRSRAFPGTALPLQTSPRYREGIPYPYLAMRLSENVDSRSLKGLLWRVSKETFSITYSIVKIPQTRIMEPIHPLLNNKMLASPGGKIISSTERSK